MALPLLVALSLSASARVPAQDVGGAIDMTGMGIYGMEDAVMDAARGGRKSSGSGRGAVKAAPVRLTFTPSMARRKRNYAAMIAAMRAKDPATADQFQALVTKSDVVALIGRRIAPLGFRVNHLSDAYALWAVAAFSASRGQEIPTNRTVLTAVRGQMSRAFGSLPSVAKLTDADKQRATESLLVQAVALDAAAEKAKGHPEMVAGLRAAARQGARASGLNVDALTLTPRGFVAK